MAARAGGLSEAGKAGKAAPDADARARCAPRTRSRTRAGVGLLLANDERNPVVLRVDDGDAVFGREVAIALQLRNVPHDRRRERAQPYVARHGSALGQSTQTQRAAAVELDIAHDDLPLLAGERQALVGCPMVNAGGLARSPDHVDDLEGAGIDDANLIIGDEIAVLAILRHQRDHRCGEYGNANRARNARADLDCELRAPRR